MAAKRRRKDLRRQQLADVGIFDPNSRTARWYERGEIDEYEARLIQFKAEYRHGYTDYDERISAMRSEAMGLDSQNKKGSLEYLREDARAGTTEQPIPETWDEYLDTYEFPYPEIANRISQVLASSRKAHPVWFCEAILAVKRAECPLDALTCEVVRDAIADWRAKRLPPRFEEE